MCIYCNGRTQPASDGREYCDFCRKTLPVEGDVGPPPGGGLSDWAVGIGMGLVCGVVIWATWLLMAWLDSLISVKTPIYFTAHSIAAAVVGVFVGCVVLLVRLDKTNESSRNAEGTGRSGKGR